MSFTFRLCQPFNSLHIAYCTGGVGPSAGLNVLTKESDSTFFLWILLLSLFLTFVPSSLFCLSFFSILSLPNSLLVYYFLPSFYLSFLFFLSSTLCCCIFAFLLAIFLLYFGSFWPPHLLFLYLSFLLSFLIALLISFIVIFFFILEYLSS